MGVGSKHIATFLLGAAAGLAAFKYANMSEEEKEKLKKTKFVVPRTLYVDFCRVCRKNRKRVSYALVTALENYIEAKDKEFF
jgi:hypothetical protein